MNVHGPWQGFAYLLVLWSSLRVRLRDSKARVFPGVRGFRAFGFTHLAHVIRPCEVQKPNGGFGTHAVLEAAGFQKVETNHEVVIVDVCSVLFLEHVAGVAHDGARAHSGHATELDTLLTSQDLQPTQRLCKGCRFPSAPTSSGYGVH
eukprot:403432-Pyramimonas_sp.AAC.1